MTNITTIIDQESGIQYQGVEDRSSRTGTYPVIGMIAGQFRRGRFDKPMTITNENIKAQLGYDPTNPHYMAVQDVLSSGVPSVQVLRLQNNNIETSGGLRYETINIPRFSPKYWRVDGGKTASFSITQYGNGFEVLFRSRMTDDLVGVLWDTGDTKDHAYLSYRANPNYKNMIWEFDIEMSESMPVLNNEQLAPTLTIRYLEGDTEKVAYVALHNYAENPNSRQSHIKIDWNEIKAGFTANIDFPVTNITQIFFSAITSSYVGNKVLGADGYPSGEDQVGIPLAYAEDGYLRVINSTVTGNNSLLKKTRVIVPKHNIGMCTSYDDHYDLNPQRIVDNLIDLGYQGFINHYCGMSHYPEIFWDTNLNKWAIPNTAETGESVVNKATRRWHEAFADALHNANMQPVFSVSFEMYSLGGNEFWAQKDINENLGRTGYEPPSYFFSMCNSEAMTYLHKAFKEFAEMMVVGNCQVNMQIGEPWWWYNTLTNLPCVYDYATRIAFNNDTGLFAPDLGTIYEAVGKTGTPYNEFKTWLRDKLGQSCRDIRAMLKDIYPDALVCPLIFFPTIRTHQESLVTYINYPKEHYSYPNFDYIMTEAYDWILETRLDLSHSAVGEIPIEELNYPPEKVAYLAGFVPNEAIAPIYGFDHTTDYSKHIWMRIFGDIENNRNIGIMKQLIWAYPQVMADAVTFDSSQRGGKFFLMNELIEPVRSNAPMPDSIYLNT